MPMNPMPSSTLRTKIHATRNFCTNVKKLLLVFLHRELKDFKSPKRKKLGSSEKKVIITIE